MTTKLRKNIQAEPREVVSHEKTCIIYKLTLATRNMRTIIGRAANKIDVPISLEENSRPPLTRSMMKLISYLHIRNVQFLGFIEMGKEKHT